jgi:hypothetical protein
VEEENKQMKAGRKEKKRRKKWRYCGM